MASPIHGQSEIWGSSSAETAWRVFVGLTTLGCSPETREINVMVNKLRVAAAREAGLHLCLNKCKKTEMRRAD